MCGGTGASTAHHSEASNRYFAILKKYSVWSVIYTVYIPRYILCLFRDMLCIFRDIFCAYSVIYCIQCIFRDIYCVYSVIYTVYIPWYILCIFRDIYSVYFVINTAYIPWENCAYSVIYTRIVYIPWYILRIFRDIYCVYLPFSVSLGRITRIYCSLLTSTHLSLIFFLFAQQIGYLPILRALDVLSLSGKENNQGRGGWGCPHEDMEDKEYKALSSRF